METTKREFSGKLTNFHISLKMDQQSLMIEVDNIESFERFKQLISLDYIGNHSGLKIAFEKPAHILDYLADNFNSIIVSNGGLKFQHKGEIYIAIELMREEINPLEVARNQIARMERQFTQREQKMSLLIELKTKELSRALQEIEALKKSKVATLPAHLAHYKRAIAGSTASPNWYDKQSQDQRSAIVKQMEQFRFLQYKSFIELTAGLPETNYKTSLYHIGQLSSPSFFFTYTFINANLPSREDFIEFLKGKFNPSRCLVTLESKVNQKTFYVMIIYDVPKAIRLYEIKHPKQAKNPLTRLTWSIKHLQDWMTKQGASDRFEFGEGKTIMEYSKMHDRYTPKPVEQKEKQENTQSSKKNQHQQTQDTVVIKQFENQEPAKTINNQ